MIQTGKIYRFAVVFFGTEYWGGLVDWLRAKVLAAKKISPEDLDLMLLVDTPEEAADCVARLASR